MASTSKNPKDQEEERDWLELGLGLSSARTKSPSFPPQPSKPELGLGLGLGLGLERNHSISHVTPPQSQPLANYYGMGYDHNLSHNHHYDKPSPLSLTLFTSPSSSSLPLHIDTTSFFGIHNDNNTHHYPSFIRPQSGLWFTLRSSINRDGEELPQLQKAYIRVKDENVTVFMVKTYLVRKLGLSNEDEVDISCMGQKLLHSQTLKHVRDAIWLPRLVESANSRTALIQNSNDISINHLMCLHYGKRCLFN